MRGWVILCRVIDHFGDAGVCWRLARQLVDEQNAQVTLWIDRPAVLACLEPALAGSPGPVRGVEVRAWETLGNAEAAAAGDADVVVSAFGCEPPAALREAMRSSPRRPVWINLEYFSAETWVDSHHGLASPKPDGLVEHFFFPGLSPASGGVLHEAGLEAARDLWQANRRMQRDFLARLGCFPREGERLLSVFAYPQAPVVELIRALESQPGLWRILLAGAPDAQRRQAWARPPGSHRIQIQALPFVSQDDYDRLLWSCDANLVRGEDSLVRALWAGRPFLWHAYRQADQAHLTKVDALVTRLSPSPGQQNRAPTGGNENAWKAAMRIWNGYEPDRSQGQPQAPNPLAVRTLARWLGQIRAQSTATRQWASDLASPGADLASRLVEFAQGRRSPPSRDPRI